MTPPGGRPAAAIALLVAALLAGCAAASGTAASSTDSTATSTATSTASADDAPATEGALEAATWAACSDVGPAVLAYLRTGENQGAPVLDTYAQQRASIEAQPDDVREGLRRQAANAATEACDERAGRAAAASASSSASASASSSSAAAAEDEAARYRATCAQHGGHVADGQCQPDLRGYLMNFMPISGDGTWDDDAASDARQSCQDYGQGYVWHQRQGVCVAP